MYQQNFKRYELKYLLSKEVYEKVSREIELRMRHDDFFRSTVQSLYFDTPDKLLVRRSIEKPFYKEKLRMRCYGRATENGKVFLEIKKKYDGVVYKRRTAFTPQSAKEFLDGRADPVSQVEKEIDYFYKFYKNLAPSTLIIYDRLAYSEKDSDLRVTFDANVRYRTDDFDLTHATVGIPLTNADQVLMEIKTAFGFPAWLCKLLSENGIYKTTFSKYGEAYKKEYYKEKENKKCFSIQSLRKTA